MELNEQVSRMKGLIYELSPKSTGVQEFIQKVKDTPGLLKFLNFNENKWISDTNKRLINTIKPIKK